jgi:VCBS repeat-containing protein
MTASRLAESTRIILLIAASTLLVHCNSDSGGQPKGTRFTGNFSGVLAEDGSGSVTGQVAAFDGDGKPLALVDAPDTASVEGYGSYSVFDGRWVYRLDNAREAVQSLDRGESLEDRFTVEAVDGSTRLVTIRIEGAEDAPLIAGDATGVVAKGRWTTVEGALSITDVDSKDNPIGFDDVPATPGSAGLGRFGLRRGTWTYSLDPEAPALDSLGTGESLLDSYVFEASDGSRFEVVVSIYSAASPNFVVLMADDLGYADVGFNGSRDIPTPNIDAIAANGIRFVQGTSSHSYCSPTRAGFLTGRYQHRFGHVFNPQYAPDDPLYGLPLDEVFLSDVLTDAGYVNGLIGKWHLGAAPQFHPNERGFQEFFGFLGGGHNYFGSADLGTPYTVPLMRNQTPLEEHPGYLTEAFSAEAVSFIERHAVVPFFLFVSYNAPHEPLQAPAEYERRYEHIEDPRRRTYAAMVSALDDGVGEVLAALRDSDLLESTLVVFLGDNGGVTANGAMNGFRGKKSTLYEGGIRVPFAMQWVGTLPAGVRYEHQISSIDVFPTIAAAAGAPMPDDRPYDGVDLLPFLQTPGGKVPHEQLFWRHFEADSDSYAVRDGRLKLISQPTGGIALYDLVSDPAESRNLADAKPAEVRRLQDAYALWNSEMTAPAAFPPKKRSSSNERP